MSTRTIIALLILAGAFFAISYDRKSMTAVPSPVACTQEAKQCPDGSYVGRTGPQCQFAACPQPTLLPPVVIGSASVNGRVTTSPTCPVEVLPPISGCNPRAYQTTISFHSLTSKPYIATSNSDGYYSILLPPGDYTVQAQGGQTYPSCPSETISLSSKQTLTKNIGCDSGIR